MEIVRELWVVLLKWMFVLDAVLVLFLVFFRRRDPKILWAWVLAIIFLPGMGLVLYLTVGRSFEYQKRFRIEQLEEQTRSKCRKQERHLMRGCFCRLDEDLRQYSNLIFYNLQSANAVFSEDNTVRILSDGKAKFADLLMEVERATQHIHIQYYIIREDEVFQTLSQSLCKKAKDGVAVRVLYDSMGCKTMRRTSWDRLRASGVQVGAFFPAVFKKIQLRPNYRNHRKIIVIDNQVAYVGGFNIGKEYVGESPKYGYWRDTHLKIRGSAVYDLQQRFLTDWNDTMKEAVSLPRVDKRHQGNVHAERVQTLNSGVGMQIVSSGPDSRYPHVRNNYVKMIYMAKHHLYIQTPYFVPDEVTLQAILTAALSGVDVRVMIPSNPDHLLVYWGTHSYLKALLEAGVKCYLYKDGFLHAKTMMADGLVSSVGTANMDMRSFHLNYEVNAILYHKNLTQELEDLFLRDLNHAEQLSLEVYEKRGFHVRCKEQLARLLAPLL